MESHWDRLGRSVEQAKASHPAGRVAAVGAVVGQRVSLRPAVNSLGASPLTLGLWEREGKRVLM